MDGSQKRKRNLSDNVGTSHTELETETTPASLKLETKSDSDESVATKKAKTEQRDHTQVSLLEVGGPSSSSTLGAASSWRHGWRKVTGDNLNVDYCPRFYGSKDSANLLKKLESEITWNSQTESRVHIFGKWHGIPRKQTAYGDEGLTYTFSGKTVRAKPWIPLLEDIRDKIQTTTGHKFNFVLLNRYKDGHDHIGEHRDDEKELVTGSPIASLSLGQTRDFIFRHRDARGKNATRKIDPVKIELESGSLLMMNYPTNSYWYHGLPVRKKALGLRINLTFRDFVVAGKVQ